MDSISAPATPQAPLTFTSRLRPPSQRKPAAPPLQPMVPDVENTVPPQSIAAANNGNSDEKKKSTTQATKKTATNAATTTTTTSSGRKLPQSIVAAQAKKPSSSRAKVATAKKSNFTLKNSPSPDSALLHSDRKASISSTTSSSSSSSNGTLKRAATSDVSEDMTMPKKKRAAWDVKGRLQDMEEMHQSLVLEVRSTNSINNEKSSRIAELEAKVDSLTQEKRVLMDRINSLELESQQLTREKIASKEEAELMRMTMQNKLDHLKNDLEEKDAELKLARGNLITMKATMENFSSQLLLADSERSSLKKRIEHFENLLQEKQTSIESYVVQINNLNETVKSQSDMIAQGEVKRRKLHNALQELKGNIRVFCRVRPLTEQEKKAPKTPEEALAAVNIPSSGNGQECNDIEIQQAQPTSLSQKPQTKLNHFTFDRVFGPETTQAKVFEEISDLVQSVLDGYRVCLFAYGQTGAGKTWTMEGPDPATAAEMSPENFEKSQGMIPRAVAQIFATAAAMAEQSWRFDVEVSLLEIYNETIRDLLVSDGVEKKHEIKHNKNSTVVTDLRIVPVHNPNDVFELLKIAAKNRAVASTMCNDRSSRSHSVFTLKIVAQNTSSGEMREGLLNLIDLAGSERLSSSGSSGERLKETQAINKSLSSLGDVIFSLANRDQHVPYRNGKLTYLLQNSLGGESKVLMFVNISPSSEHIQETLCSLRFATKVNSCQIGVAKRNVK